MVRPVESDKDLYLVVLEELPGRSTDAVVVAPENQVDRIAELERQIREKQYVHVLGFSVLLRPRLHRPLG